MDDFLYVSEVIKRKRFIDLNPQNIIKLRLFEQSSTPSRLFSLEKWSSQSVRKSPKKCIEHKDQFLTEIQRFEKQIIFERKVHIRHFLVISKHCGNTPFSKIGCWFSASEQKIIALFLLFLSSFSAKKQLKTYARPKSRFLLLGKCIWYKKMKVTRN